MVIAIGVVFYELKKMDFDIAFKESESADAAKSDKKRDVSPDCDEPLLCLDDGPSFCNVNRIKSERCDICGCPEGEVCNSETKKCIDPGEEPGYFWECFYNKERFRGSCSSIKPFYCSEKVGDQKCDKCGCPSGYDCDKKSGLCVEPNSFYYKLMSDKQFFVVKTADAGVNKIFDERLKAQNFGKNPDPERVLTYVRDEDRIRIKGRVIGRKYDYMSDYRGRDDGDNIFFLSPRSISVVTDKNFDANSCDEKFSELLTYSGSYKLSQLLKENKIWCPRVWVVEKLDDFAATSNGAVGEDGQGSKGDPVGRSGDIVGGSISVDDETGVVSMDFGVDMGEADTSLGTGSSSDGDGSGISSGAGEGEGGGDGGGK